LSVVVDTSVLIDYLRGIDLAVSCLRGHREKGPTHASEMSRLDVLAGMRPNEEEKTRILFTTLTWHPVTELVVEVAGDLGRACLPRRRGIDAADLAIAATAKILRADLLTLNVKHFPMFEGLTAAY
jgi:predicted nucleic acid-binding protein